MPLFLRARHGLQGVDGAGANAPRRTPSTQRSRAKALSVTILSLMAFGFSPAEATAADVVVQGTVAACLVSIGEVGPVDLGTPTLLTGEQMLVFLGMEQQEFADEPPDVYIFGKYIAFSVEWQTAGNEACAGSLHAEHSGFKKNGVDSELIGLNLSDDEVGAPGSFWDRYVPVGKDLSSEVATSPNGYQNNVSEFDAVLFVPAYLGPGTYSTTLTFTVVLR